MYVATYNCQLMVTPAAGDLEPDRLPACLVGMCVPVVSTVVVVVVVMAGRLMALARGSAARGNPVRVFSA